MPKHLMDDKENVASLKALMPVEASGTNVDNVHQHDHAEEVEIEAIDNTEEYHPSITVSSIIKLVMFVIGIFLAYIGLYGYL